MANSKKQHIDKSKPILVTGGSGYIGTHVVEKLLENGYNVRIYDQFMFGDKHIDDFKKNKKVEIFHAEVGEISKLMNAMEGSEAVIHLAGLVGDPACAVNEEMTIKMNIISTRIVKDLAKVFNLKRFIFASSCSVYGASELLANERGKLNPVSLYARTKIDSEREILKDSDPTFHPTVLRFATVYGHSRRQRFDLVANLFIAQAFNNGLITVTGSKQWRPFVHVSDIGRAVIKVLEADLSIVVRQIFNVGDDTQNMTIGGLASLVSELVQTDKRGNKVKVVIKDDIDDIRNYRVSFRKINKVLGFEAATKMENGLSELHRNFKNGLYKDNFQDPIYINVEMTKLLHAGKNP